MPKERTLEVIEAEMAKLRKEKDALHAKRKALAAERRTILKSREQSPAGVVLTPEPADLEAKPN